MSKYTENSKMGQLEKMVTEKLYDSITNTMFECAGELGIPTGVALSLNAVVDIELDPQLLMEAVQQEQNEVVEEALFQYKKNGIDLSQT